MNQLSPKIIQIVGLTILLFSTGFWAVSGKQSIELISASMTMITLGLFWSAQGKVEKTQEKYELPKRPIEDPIEKAEESTP